MNYDPLGDREWAAGQAENRFQASVREYEDLTGRQHPLSDSTPVESKLKRTCSCVIAKYEDGRVMIERCPMHGGDPIAGGTVTERGGE